MGFGAHDPIKAGATLGRVSFEIQIVQHQALEGGGPVGTLDAQDYVGPLRIFCFGDIHYPDIELRGT